MDEIVLTPKYSKINALTLGELSNLVYEDWDKVKAEIGHFGRLVIYDKQDTQAFLLVTDTHVLTLFRGTQSLKDFQTDIKIRKIGGTHGGFYTGLKHIWPEMRVDIADVMSDSKQLFIGGHSLGGGLATEASNRVRDWFPDHEVYTYGCPRVFSRTKAKEYNKYMLANHHRHVNNNDIVTRIPPRLLNYSHVGTFHYYMENGMQNDDISNWSRFCDRVHGRMLDIGELGTDGLKDHSMDDYLYTLKLALG